jgi:dTMP kinase
MIIIYRMLTNLSPIVKLPTVMGIIGQKKVADLTRGMFITVEGGEGVGKSLFVKLFSAELQKLQANPVILTNEPGGTPVAESIRQIFKRPPQDDPLTPLTELFLVSAARTQHVQKRVLPALAKGEWVLCDRFADSTRVYQGEMPGIDATVYETLINVSVGSLKPDITFLLDCPVDIIMERIAGRKSSLGDSSESDRFDEASRDYHDRLRKAFLKVARAHAERIFVLNAQQEPHLIVDDAVAVLKRELRLRE